MELEVLTLDAFSDKVGETFVVEEGDVPATELTLVEANALRNYARVEREPFSLVFTGRGDFVLPQRIYALRHAKLGLQSIFLVPIGKDGDVVSYQATFN